MPSWKANAETQHTHKQEIALVCAVALRTAWSGTRIPGPSCVKAYPAAMLSPHGHDLPMRRMQRLHQWAASLWSASHYAPTRSFGKAVLPFAAALKVKARQGGVPAVYFRQAADSGHACWHDKRHICQATGTNRARTAPSDNPLSTTAHLGARIAVVHSLLTRIPQRSPASWQALRSPVQISLAPLCCLGFWGFLSDHGMDQTAYAHAHPTQ